MILLLIKSCSLRERWNNSNNRSPKTKPQSNVDGTEVSLAALVACGLVRSSLSAQSFKKAILQKIQIIRQCGTAEAWIGTRGLRTRLFLGERGKGNALFKSVADVQSIVDPQEAADSAGLKYVSDARAGRRRKSSREGFTHTCADEAKLTDAGVIGSVKSLVVPCCRPFTRPYDRAELIADAMLHAAGIVFAVTGLALLISMAGGLPGFQGTSVWIYGIGLVTVV